ncbi:uncharacterized protein IWZ02DRAFT_221610 [Phyllosticta citriasiana]|uniref:uncharacterized protein n=1 Tax=Phyllosticta citriasiana TaxID=595635 RepID=UPI0030FD5B41
MDRQSQAPGPPRPPDRPLVHNPNHLSPTTTQQQQQQQQQQQSYPPQYAPHAPPPPPAASQPPLHVPYNDVFARRDPFMPAAPPRRGSYGISGRDGWAPNNGMDTTTLSFWLGGTRACGCSTSQHHTQGRRARVECGAKHRGTRGPSVFLRMERRALLGTALAWLAGWLAGWLFFPGGRRRHGAARPPPFRVVSPACLRASEFPLNSSSLNSPLCFFFEFLVSGRAALGCRVLARSAGARRSRIFF